MYVLQISLIIIFIYIYVQSLCTNEHYCRHIFGSLLNLYVSITVCQLFRSPIRQQCMHGSNNFFLFSKKKRRTMHACRRREWET